MSFLTQTAARRVALTSRVAVAQAPRHFTTSIAARKSATETAKDAVKTVDRKVSDKLVDGIEATTDAAHKVTGAEAKGKAKGTAEELSGQAKGKAEELKGEAKGTAQEAAGKAKGAADKM